mgnify:CR=1 FL=1
MLKYQVVYASRTGNTQKVAAKIFETLPGTSKDIQRKQLSILWVFGMIKEPVLEASWIIFLTFMAGRLLCLEPVEWVEAGNTLIRSLTE